MWVPKVSHEPAAVQAAVDEYRQALHHAGCKFPYRVRGTVDFPRGSSVRTPVPDDFFGPLRDPRIDFPEFHIPALDGQVLISQKCFAELSINLGRPCGEKDTR